MKTVILVTLSAFVVSVASIACSDPAPAPSTDSKNQTSKKKETKGDDDDDATKAPTKTAPSASASASSTATPAPSGSGSAGMPTTAEVEQAKTCMNQCVAADPKAKQIFDTSNACNAKCAETDDACFEQCFKAEDQVCQTAQASCAKLDECGDKCFGALDANAGDPPPR